MMEQASNVNILQRIFINLESFRDKLISIEDLIKNISGNITALEGTNDEFIDNFQNFLGEIEFIQFTENKDVSYKLISKIVIDYERYLRQYFFPTYGNFDTVLISKE